jgi:hypothetical protein
MVIQHIKIFAIQRASKIVKKLGVWFENKPSGNPASNVSATVSYQKREIS